MFDTNLDKTKIMECLCKICTVCATVHLNRSNINLSGLDFFFSKLQYSNGNGANPVFFCLSALVLKARGQKNMFFKNGVSTF